MNRNFFEHFFSHLIIVFLFFLYVLKKNSEIEILIKKISELEEKSSVSKIIIKEKSEFLNNDYLIAGSILVFVLFLVLYFNSKDDGGIPDSNFDSVTLGQNINNLVCQKKVSELRETFINNYELESLKNKIPSDEELDLFLNIFSN